MERLTIIGMGYTGLRLARQARAHDLEVLGTTRDAERSAQARAFGAQVLDYDIIEDAPSRLDPYLDANTTVVYSVPTLRAEDEPLAPLRRLLDHLKGQPLERFIYLSSTSVYGDHQGQWVDEESECRPSSATGEQRLASEELVAGCAESFATNSARIVGIYGPGRSLVEYIQRGRYRLVDGGSKPGNRVHVDDLVSAIFAIAQRAPKEGARTYNISDGDPRPVVELVDFLAQDLGVIERPPEESLEDYAARRGPNVVARWKNSTRVSNARLREELGWSPIYPNAIEGYRAIYGDHEG